MNTRLTACLAASLVLWGCTSMTPGTKMARQAESADVSSYFAARLETGRRYLEIGLPTKALEAFRQASYDQRQAADAYNGMGVAYSMLGRQDVARRMFNRAIDANPLEQKYLRNLARLDALPGANGRGAEALAGLAPDDAAGTVSPQTGTSPQAGPQRITVSGGGLKSAPAEVFVKTAASSAVKETRIYTQRGNSDASSGAGKGVSILSRAEGSSYPVRVELPNTNRAGYPLRVALPRGNGARYPLRVELPSKAKSNTTGEAAAVIAMNTQGGGRF